VALGCQAQLSSRKGDPLKELEHRQDLVATLPVHPAAVESLLQFEGLLVRLWQVDEATQILERVPVIQPLQIPVGEVERLSGRRAALADGKCVVVEMGEVSLETLIRAAEMLDQPFLFRWLIHPMDEISCLGTSILPEEFGKQCETLLAGNASDLSALVRCEETRFLSSNDAASTDESVIFFHQDGHEPGLEYVLRFRKTLVETVVIPHVVFNAGRNSQPEQVHEHNTLCLRSVNRPYSDRASTSWLRHVHKVAMEALGRLVKRSLSGRHRRFAE